MMKLMALICSYCLCKEPKEPKELGIPEISACPIWSLQALMSLGALILGMPCSESFTLHKAPAMYAAYTFHICKNFCTH
jgi:hypothetical protein